MTSNYLFPHRYKRIGWWLFIPTALLGLFTLITDFEPNFLTMRVPAIISEPLFEKTKTFSLVENNILNEILGILLIISLLFIAFSKEKVEDEFISKIRLEALVWAVYINYGILLFALLFVFDLPFLWVMLFNMFTVLIIFIIRYYWQLRSLN